MSKKPYGAIETARFSYNFLSDNFEHFKSLVIPLLPVLLPFTWISGFIHKAETPHIPFLIYAIWAALSIAAFIYTSAFMIAWHRAVILGPSESNRVKPLQLSDDEKSFIKNIILIVVGLFAIGTIGGAILGLIATILLPVAVILGVIGIIAVIYYSLRLYLFFPAKATGADITLFCSIPLSKGLLNAMLTSIALSAIPASIVGYIAVAIASMALSLFIGAPVTIMSGLVFYLLLAPLRLFIHLIVLAASVGVISRYYIWATQERGLKGEKTNVTAPTPDGTKE